MAIYAIGDLQGCYSELIDLLGQIDFDGGSDRLWFTGDLVNRGPQSLECLRFVRQLGNRAVTVLGNHDLHLLAIAAGKMQPKAKDTIEDILAAQDREELLDWLRQQPLMHYDRAAGYLMVHAGLPPQWDTDTALELAAEVESVLQSNNAGEFYDNMYGNQPDLWSEELTGMDRLRFITNCFTRIRYCHEDGRLDLADKNPPGRQAGHLIPWFQFESRPTKTIPILFGHWASLPFGNIKSFTPYNIYPLDTGCVWGRRLTAMRLEDGKMFSVPSRQPIVEEN
ncbi:MAG: symmetrical bis(5'-nucleosyl)-tetraphosphatase [Gammaproteobacteria bacterium]